MLLTLPGCSSLGYYLEAINGHFTVLEQEKPVVELLAQPTLTPALREKLSNLQQARTFASETLYLPDNDSYRSYADIGRRYVTWNVVATAPLSIRAKQWCFLFVGCVSYRGYFSKEKAQAFADTLRAQGMDVYVVGARAYSTLGWFDDPLLNTMLDRSEAVRVGTLFHELAHQLLYRENDSAFNEAFATVVEQEGLRRWFIQQGNDAKYTVYLKEQMRDAQFKQLLLHAREKLHALYQSDLSEDEKHLQKQNDFAELKQRYQAFKQHWKGYGGYDAWMAQELNNAHLALVATYQDKVPAFQALLKNSGGDLKIFYAQAAHLSRLSATELESKLGGATNENNRSEVDLSNSP